MKTDPVCGMKVDEKTSRFRAERGGVTYYFCSAVCERKFTADPSKYVK
jgi:Cu+-exporting ATPase